MIQLRGKIAQYADAKMMKGLILPWGHVDTQQLDERIHDQELI